MKYLGHIIHAHGISTDPDKILSVQEWATPTTIRQVRSFLGLASYYRNFIPDFTSVAQPLIRLTEKDVHFSWQGEQQKAFETLKKLLTTAPILAYPKDVGWYIIDTDASQYGIGAVLSQEQDGVERVIAYASKSLSKTQRRYCVTKKELLAVVYFVGHRFRHYLGPEDNFLIRTDHASLKWLMTSFCADEDMIGRWLEILSKYHFQVEHRKGTHHLNADALSRIPPCPCPRDDCPQCSPSENFDDDDLITDVQGLIPPAPRPLVYPVTSTPSYPSADDSYAETGRIPGQP